MEVAREGMEVQSSWTVEEREGRRVTAAEEAEEAEEAPYAQPWPQWSCRSCGCTRGWCAP